MGRELLALGEVLGYREEKKRKEMERVVSRPLGLTDKLSARTFGSKNSDRPHRRRAAEFVGTLKVWSLPRCPPGADGMGVVWVQSTRTAGVYAGETAWHVVPNMDLSFHSKCQRKLW